MDRIKFKINGDEYTVGGEVSSDMTLLDYIRNRLELKGTKYMCRQAGCGACIVSARRSSEQPYAVNSCMIPITACHGLDITTIEELGNRKKGYHLLQTILADYNGSQCGYCSPGWIMAMYSLLQSQKDLTMLEIEQSFGSNICRCTGYRSILDAFKRFAKNSPASIKVPDIEELHICKKNCGPCDKICEKDNGDDWCMLSINDVEHSVLKMNLKDGIVWYRASTLHDVFEVIKSEEFNSYKLICGNTAKGVYPKDDEIDNPRVLIDISAVKELKGHSLDQNLVLGAGNTLTEMMEKIELIAEEEYFGYLKILYDHIKLVAHIPVKNNLQDRKTASFHLHTSFGNEIIKKRTKLQCFNPTLDSDTRAIQRGYTHHAPDAVLDICFAPTRSIIRSIMLRMLQVGSIAGNLMIKHRHNEFQSDIYLLLETVGAQLTIVSILGTSHVVTLTKFLQLDMKGKIILNVFFPPFNNEYRITTFKVMPRSQNAHAIVNAGFLYKLNRDNIVQQARIVFGGLSSNCNRATATEKFLQGKTLFKNNVLQSALNILKAELIVTENPPEPSAAYRKALALGLFYKGLLTLCPKNIVRQSFKSGSIRLHETRPISGGQQTFDTDPSTWPINQPIPRREGLIQCAGEAMYTDDIPIFPKEVYGAFVLSTVGKGRIAEINSTEALKCAGVLACYTSKDIPGLNSFTPIDDPVYRINEEVFCSGDVKYFNQPIALLIANTQIIANKAAKIVKVRYANIAQPVVNISEAKKDKNRNILYKEIIPTDKGNDIVKIVKGGNTILGQYHLPLETLVCVSKPTEEGLAVYATAQWLGAMQTMISRALKLDQSRIDVHVRRLGGSYGIKISRSIQIAVAASLVAMKMNRPCRITQTLEANTRAMGKRFPCSTDYEVGVNKSGVFQYVKYNLHEDNGYDINEDLSQFGVNVFNNCYNSFTWNYKCFNTLTDTAKNTWFRSPGTLENIAMVEMLMEQISYELSIDPIKLRLINLDPQHNDLKEMFDTLNVSSNYKSRRITVNKFNTENRWKKRGIRFVFLRWEHIYARYFDVNLSVFQGDGTVIISHGGVEIGQGINTKAAQIAAYMLKIPLNKIIVKENNTTISPNSAVTGGSLTTQNIIIAVEKCCIELLTRLAPVRRKLNNPSWEELISKSFEMMIDLQVHGFVGKDDIQNYQIYGVTLAEVEIDVLTGEHEILRVDILQDVGRSLNPTLDVGQVEGAFVMGTGYWTCEKLVYDMKTGELLTDRTWNYYVPQARDIPQDFRVYFRKKSYTNKVIFGSKACGEPPMCMAVSIPIAIREAIVSARQEAGIPSTKWFNIDGPYTTEQICLACKTETEDFKFN